MFVQSTVGLLAFPGVTTTRQGHKSTEVLVAGGRGTGEWTHPLPLPFTVLEPPRLEHGHASWIRFRYRAGAMQQLRSLSISSRVPPADEVHTLL